MVFRLALLICCLALEVLPAVSFVIESPDVTISLPDGFRHDTEDDFGYVIVPPGRKVRQKLRIHYTGVEGLPLEQAATQAIERINKWRSKAGQLPETVIFSKPVQTASGLKGQLVRVGSSPEGYLDHYYFADPSGRIICVCVYYYGKIAFAEAMQRAIVDTLSFRGK